MERYEEQFNCYVCKAEVMITIFSDPDRGAHWHQVPPGWLVDDSYPPGDDGLYFLCPNCARSDNG